ncbi:TPA: hypothetical protein DDW35_10120 [Candidatus Sumerlaeota bacterium]|jgi:sugar/nucleoside kinase (ribokinase family)|nr:hypothetical protein [Candidatus Sumerlaeota bacterium]
MFESASPPLVILGVGIIPLDCLYYHEPGASEPILQEVPGGTITNALCALAALGNCEPSLVGVVGDDDAGNRIVNHCKNFGIRTDGLRQKPHGVTRHLRIDLFPRPDVPGEQKVLREFEERCIASPRDIKLGAWWRNALPKLDWLHCDATAKPVQTMVQQAVSAGKIISFDFGRTARWGMKGPLEILQHVAVLKTNRHLLSQLLGSAESEDGACLFGRFPALRVALITDAANGMELLWKSNATIQRTTRAPYPVPGGADALGAGDAALGMLIHCLGMTRELWWNGNAGFTETFATEILSQVSAISALCCTHRSACGYLLHLREQGKSLLDALAEIRKNSHRTAYEK